MTATSTPVQHWYHTLDLPHQPPTPGWFDLRPITGLLPWPDLRGKRVLDIATYDGFFAFEAERRGAAEVVATDIGDHHSWDWPIMVRDRAGDDLGRMVGERGSGFEYACAALGSAVSKVQINVYDLSPEAVGSFDVVILGSLLLHLRDPVRALEAIRSVTGELFMSVEAISLPLSVLFPRRPVAELATRDAACQWWTANVAGHRRLLQAAGFEIVRSTRPFLEPYGASHPESRPHRRDLRTHAHRALRRVVLGGHGVPHTAALARPAP